MERLNSFQVDQPSDLVLIERLLAFRRPQAKRAELSAVRLLVLDFDGVMTDNRVLVTSGGQEAVWCHRGDSLGIARLKEAGVDVIVLSTETDPVVSARCRKLGIECIQGADDKLLALRQLTKTRSLVPDQVAYVGNDINDLRCLEWVGVANRVESQEVV